jgi:hypothetical protein
MRKTGILLCFIVVGFTTLVYDFSSAQEEFKVKDLMDKTMAAIQSNTVLSFTFTRSERIKGKMESGSSQIKLETSPFKLYLKTLGPDGGKELLYGVQGGSKAVIEPNAFPYVTLRLDPFSSILRDKNHHTIFEIGFTYFGKIMTSFSRTINYKYKDFCTIDGEMEWKGRKCISVTCIYPQFAYVTYVVKKNESLTSIAARLNLSDYMMLEKNSETVDDYDDLDEGEEILIPNLYCKKITFYIDKENFLPIRQLIYDDLGLFEEYHYLNVNNR